VERGSERCDMKYFVNLKLRLLTRAMEVASELYLIAKSTESRLHYRISRSGSAGYTAATLFRLWALVTQSSIHPVVGKITAPLWLRSFLLIGVPPLTKVSTK
jgi:hypothetical protein